MFLFVTALNFCYTDHKAALVTVLVNCNSEINLLGIADGSSVICLGADVIPSRDSVGNTSPLRFTVVDEDQAIGSAEVLAIELVKSGRMGSNFEVRVDDETEPVGYLHIVGFCPDSLSESGARYLAANGYRILSGLHDRLLVHVMDGLGRPLRKRTGLVARFEILQSSEPHTFYSADTQSTVCTRYLQFDSRLSLDLPPVLNEVVLRVSLLDVGAEASNTTAVDSADRNMDGKRVWRVVGSMSKSLSDIVIPLNDRPRLLRRTDLIVTLECHEKNEGSSIFEASSERNGTSGGDQKNLRLRLGLLFVPARLACTKKAIDAVKLFNSKKGKT